MSAYAVLLIRLNDKAVRHNYERLHRTSLVTIREFVLANRHGSQ
jgi:hypothetical protein